ncbi:hypothetical protein L3Q82_019834 [Scortum barcoo]|uniref:Uncharacterized protein n=1 Tax=Scortum barcoo TaxID=214431 RepID=A0ACB8VCQ1_9TELE|nr:hypothetical protein L3Q82_019834 [Scortum barcoo]
MGNISSCKKKQEEEEEKKRREGTVFKPPLKGTEVYRIPALIYDTDNKMLLAFAEKRISEKDSSTEELVMKTGTVNRDEPTQEVKITWSELSTVVKKDKDYRPMNPCPVYDKTSKTLYLFFIRVKGEERDQIEQNKSTARLYYITSTDFGQTWSDEADLPETLPVIKNWATFAVGPGHGLQTESGCLIVPVYAHIKSEKVVQYALALYKDQSDTNWKFGKMLPNESGECQMAEVVHEQHKSFIYCNARTKEGFREEAVSENNGEDFYSKGDLKLVETKEYEGCQGSVVSFPAQSEGANGDLSQSQNTWLLYTHPSDESKRINIAVYLNKSPQEQNAWSKPWIIYNGPSAYSDLAWLTLVMVGLHV